MFNIQCIGGGLKAGRAAAKLLFSEAGSIGPAGPMDPDLYL